MRAPLSWLRDYAPFDQPVGELADALTDLGLVVDGVQAVGVGLDAVVVAQILDIRPHPGADRIRLVDVDAGDGQALQIACGAWNMSVGDLVPLAPVGAVLPGGTEISRRKMRGEWSNGMLCSSAELELPEPEGDDGLLILPAQLAAPGTPLVDALGLGADTVFDLDVSPNRPDALCMAGISRDLAAALRVPWAWPVGPPAHPRAAAGPAPARPPVLGAAGRAGVEVADPDLCPRFTATLLDDVEVGTSPPWLARRLALAGMRPINSVVDVSNYVMLDVGQPNHAYDRDRLSGGGLLVRRAEPGEELVTLDGVTRRLRAEDLLVCDATGRPVGLAGIMGGADAEVAPTTTSVLLEAAWFVPVAVARTGARLGLNSEARVRFERGVDPELAPRAVERFVELLGALGPRPLRRGPLVDLRDEEALPRPRQLSLRTGRVNALLGTSLEAGEVAGLLEHLGFGVVPAAGGVHQVTVPTWRPDCEREIDLVEEVARLHGYAHIPRTLPAGAARTGRLGPLQRERRAVRDILAGAGLSEAWTSTFLAPSDLARAGLDPTAVEVENPLDQAESVLRSALLPGLLGALRFNVDRQAAAVGLFEVGRVFAPGGAGGLPVESERVGAAVAAPGADARLAARLWSVLAGALRLSGSELHAASPPGLHPTRSAQARRADGTVIGVVGEVDPDVVTASGLTGRVAYLELDLEVLLGTPRQSRRARAVSRYPASDVDVALVVADAVPASAVLDTLVRAGGELVESAGLFDVYRSDALGAGRRSLAFRLRLRAPDRTLGDAELAACRQAVLDAAASAHGAMART